MAASLHYGDTKIQLPDDGDYARLRHDLSQAEADGGWLSLVDFNGDTHHVKVSPGQLIRIHERQAAVPQVW